MDHDQIRRHGDWNHRMPTAPEVGARIAHARELLSDPTYSLSDISYASGFSSQAHMTDVFRKKLGVTPGLYRDLSRD